MQNVGKLSERVDIFGAAVVDGNIEKVRLKTVWAYAERQKGRSIFASYGLAAESWRFIMRKTDISPAQILSLDGFDYYVTDVFTDKKQASTTVQAARVVLSLCVANGRTFFGVLTEKFSRNNDENAYRSDERTVILVTPKEAVLRDGDEVEIDGKAVYIVRLVHDMDPYRNEYEIWNKKDV